MAGPYDTFQAEFQRIFGRPATQEELDNSPYLETLSNEIVRLLPAGRLEAFSSQRLMALDNADLFALIMHNPHIANSLPGYRLTQGVQKPDGSWSGGFSGTQIQTILGAAQSAGIGGGGINELTQAYSALSGGQPAGQTTTEPPPDPTATLAREQWEAELANQPGNVYSWLFRSRGMEPVGQSAGGAAGGLPSREAVEDGIGGITEESGWPSVSGGVPGVTPGGDAGHFPGDTRGWGGRPSMSAGGNPYSSAGQQITDQPRPTFDQLRQQVQGVGGEIPPGVLNPILGQPTGSYTAQGGMPLLAAQTAARMSPAERAVWDVTVNRTGGRAEDDDYMARRLGRTGSGASIAYTGASRTPGERR